MIHLVTFASDDMSIAKERCVESAIQCGVEKAYWFGEHFTKFILGWKDVPSRGFGYWAWKPAIIQKTMGRANDGDYVIYSDAGVEFIEPVQIVIDRMDQDIFLFGNEHEHLHWCKQSIIECIWPIKGIADVEQRMRLSDMRFGKQCQASVIFFRVSDYSRQFVAEWLKWCLFNNGELIDDSPSWIGNHPEFKENRHDQAILTTMAYREGIKLHEWYVKYEGYTPGRMTSYPREFERPLFFHHRRRNHEWEGVAA